jgi:hypothetical protein
MRLTTLHNQGRSNHILIADKLLQQMAWPLNLTSGSCVCGTPDLILTPDKLVDGAGMVLYRAYGSAVGEVMPACVSSCRRVSGMLC